MRIAYIHSLARSGSTFLQTMLSAHPDAIALGELARTVKNYSQNDGEDPIDQVRTQLGMHESKLSDRPCNCGESRENCSFWGDLLPAIKGQELLSAHRQVLEKVRTNSPGKLLIDNSKTRASFDHFYNSSTSQDNNGIQDEVRVIVLIRDFRGWVRSNEKHQKVNSQMHQGMRRFLQGYLPDSYRWYSANRRLLSGLKTLNVPYCVVTYESLVFQFDHVFPLLASFLGLNFEQIPPAVDYLESHELYGSLGVKKQIGQIGIRYDGSWMTDPRPVVYSPLLAPVYRLNSRLQKQYGAKAINQQVERYSTGSIPPQTSQFESISQS